METIDYLDLGKTCIHCGKALESAPDYEVISVTGYESMKHRHMHNKNNGCVKVIRSEAECYSTLNLRDKYNLLFKSLID